MRRTPIAILCVLACLAVAPAAGALETPLHQAREEAGEPPLTPTTWPLPGALLTVSPSDLLGSGLPQRVTFALRLDRPRPSGALAVVLPAAFSRTPASGIRATRPPRAGPGDAIERDGRSVVVEFTRAEREFTFSLEVVGLAAGRYTLPLRWRDGASAAFEPAGAAELTVFPPAREAQSRPGDGWRGVAPRSAVNASADLGTQSEAFVTTDPGNANRVLVAANGGSDVEAFLDTGSGVFQKRVLPALADVPGTPAHEVADGTCDPVLAADPAGSLWFGGLTRCGGEGTTPPQRIVLGRIAPSNAAPTLGVGLPLRPGSVAQDKPMITFDPVERRIYATWIEISNQAATQVVLTWCNVDAAGAGCDNADAWLPPIALAPAGGSYIYPDVATSPDGDVYVVWWDYSSNNSIQGAACENPCFGTFGPTQTIALLDGTGGVPLPFACPILVAPGGRVGAVPSVEVDRTTGRVYVSWGDLRPGSGTTRCEYGPNGGTPPLSSHRTWDAYVASKVGALPGAAQPSADVGTPLIVDGDEGVAASSDDFLPWLAVDGATGDVWAALYSTGHDPTRQEAHFVSMSVLAAGAGGHLVGPANRVSAGASSFAGTVCCQLDNDFGDYEGVAAAQGQVIPAWTDNSTGHEDVFVSRGLLQTVGFDLEVVSATELAGADGDHLSEPGETVRLTVRARNTGTRTATGATGPLLEGFARVDGAGLTVAPAQVTFPSLAPDAAAEASSALDVAIAPDYDCARPPSLRLAVSAAEGAENVAVPLVVGCPPGSVPPPAPPTPPQPAAVVAGLVDLEVPSGQRLRTVRSRGLRLEVLCAGACRVNLSMSINARTAKRLKTRLRSLGRAVAAAGDEPRPVRLRLSLEARRAVARARSVRVRIDARVSGASPGQTALLSRTTVLGR